jgi:hypothetical protein
MKKLFLTIAFILCLVSNVWATDVAQTYYVTQAGRGLKNGTSYDNAWDLAQFEDFATNWSTSDSVAKIDPGDTVYTLGDFDFGDTTEEIDIVGSGNANADVTIDCTDGENPNGRILAERSTVWGGFYISGQNYLVLKDCQFPTGSHFLTGTGIYIDGNSSNIEITGFSFIATMQNAIEVWPGDGETVSDLLIHGNYFTPTDADPAWRQQDAVNLVLNDGDINYVTVEENDFSGWYHSGVDITTSACAIDPADCVSNGKGLNNNDCSCCDGAGSGTCTEPVNGRGQFIFVRKNKWEAGPSQGYARFFILVSNGYNTISDVEINHNWIDKTFISNQILGAKDVSVFGNIFDEGQNCCGNTAWTGCSGRNTSICLGSYTPSFGPCLPSPPGTGFGSYYGDNGIHLFITDGNNSINQPESITGLNNTFYGMQGQSVYADYTVLVDFTLENNLWLENGLLNDYCDDPPGSFGTARDYSVVLKSTTNLSFKNNAIFSTNREGLDELVIDHSPGAHTTYTVAQIAATAWGAGTIEDDADLVDVVNENFAPLSRSGVVGKGLDKGDSTDGCVSVTNEPACGLASTTRKSDFGVAGNLSFVDWDVVGWNIGAMANEIPTYNDGTFRLRIIK